MSFTKKTLPVSKHEYFRFFASESHPAVAWDDTMDEQFDPSCGFFLEEIRLHLSTTHASAVSFCVLYSNAIDSIYNEMLISQAMFGVKDVVWQPSFPRLYYPGDTLSIAMPMSAPNTYGLVITGWAVTQTVG
jgi:hypothetical protein